MTYIKSYHLYNPISKIELRCSLCGLLITEECVEVRYFEPKLGGKRVKSDHAHKECAKKVYPESRKVIVYSGE